MRTLVFSKYRTKRIEGLLKRHGFSVVKWKPELVVCWGGDGTLLLAESKFPGIPKLVLGKSATCKKCVYEDPETAIIKLAKQKKLKVSKKQKFQAILTKGKRKITLPLAMNDIVLRNKQQMHAIRFSVKAGKLRYSSVIGDGLVVSTPFGSTAYYHSITRDSFKKGIGLAFNNTVENIPTKVFSDTVSIAISMERGDGLISIDTLDKTWTMKAGDTLTVKTSNQVAKIVRL